MKNLFKRFLLLTILGGFALGCSDDSEILTDTEAPDSDFDVILAFDEADTEKTIANVSVTPTTGTITASLQITSTSNMRRVYITRSIGGAGFQDYIPENLINEDGINKKITKPDGSIDVETDPNNIKYTLDLDVPSGITEGTVVYRFWATSGRGDYRDPEKRKVAGVSEIVLNYGGTDGASPVKSFTATMLSAPTADENSRSFITVFNGTTYKISNGDENAALWDFGYFYGNTNLASFASTFSYPSVVVDIISVVKGQNANSDLTKEQLNKAYFQVSTAVDGAKFDSITLSSELDALTISDTNPQTVNKLNAGDIVEFMTNYGKKGLIKVESISPGNGTSGSITIDIKVQP